MKLFLLATIFVLISGCMGRKPSVVTGKEGKPMPSFNLLLMDSITRFNTKDIPLDKPIVLFLFSPYCPYCRTQTKEIIDDIKSMESIRILLISPIAFSPIKSYYSNYELGKYPNIVVGQDEKSNIGNYFNASVVPYIAIYTKDKQLKQVLMGKVSTKMIKSIALE